MRAPSPRYLMSLFTLGVAFLGCGAAVEAPDVVGISQSADTEYNRMRFNRLRFNRVRFNRVRFNRIRFNRIRFNNVQLNGAALSGTMFYAQDPGQGWMHGYDFIGSEFTLGDDGEDGPTMKVTNIEQSPDPTNWDILLYTAVWTDSNEPICGLDEDNQAIRVIPLAGYWDEEEGATGGDHINSPDFFTFACEGYVLAECAEMGYKPWRYQFDWNGRRWSVVSLADHHQACTRMLRADYCGDGSSYTEDHTLINQWDKLPNPIANRKFPGYRGSDWKFEAEWTTEGATCLKTMRHPELAPVACQSQLDRPNCGATGHFGDEVLLMTEVPRD